MPDDPTLTTGKFAGLGDYYIPIAVATHVPDDIDYNYGVLFLEMFTRPIPRLLWPGKRYFEGEAWSRFHQVAHTSDYVNPLGLYGGPPATFVGKWFYIGGWVGLVIGGLITGSCLAVVWQYVMRYGEFSRSFLMTSVCLLGFSEVNNPQIWIVYWLPWVGIPCLLALRVVRTYRPQSATRWLGCSLPNRATIVHTSVKLS